MFRIRGSRLSPPRDPWKIEFQTNDDYKTIVVPHQTNSSHTRVSSSGQVSSAVKQVYCATYPPLAECCIRLLSPSDKRGRKLKTLVTCTLYDRMSLLNINSEMHYTIDLESPLLGRSEMGTLWRGEHGPGKIIPVPGIKAHYLREPPEGKCVGMVKILTKKIK